MSKTILSYPDGVAGIALLLMRLSAGLVAWPVLSSLLEPAGPWPGGVVALLLAGVLVLGAFTRIAAMLLAAALAALLAGVSGEVMLPLLACAGNVAALALLGPGAFSADARWYGRRVIKLVARSPDRGDPD
jgi:hypothetical protein